MANDPNFPPGPTFGKNIVSTGPNGDKQLAGNFFGSAPPNGSKLTNWTPIDGAKKCTESGNDYFRYSLSVDKPSVHTAYALIGAGATGGSPLTVAHNAIAVSHQAPNNAVTFGSDHPGVDCHSVAQALTVDDFRVACQAAWDSCAGSPDQLACAQAEWPAVDANFAPANSGHQVACESVDFPASGDWVCDGNSSGISVSTCLVS